MTAECDWLEVPLSHILSPLGNGIGRSGASIVSCFTTVVCCQSDLYCALRQAATLVDKIHYRHSVLGTSTRLERPAQEIRRAHR